jgi:hypothetical protein
MTGQTVIAFLRYSSIEEFNCLTPLPYSVEDQVLTETSNDACLVVRCLKNQNIYQTEMFTPMIELPIADSCLTQFYLRPSETLSQVKLSAANELPTKSQR